MYQFEIAIKNTQLVINAINNNNIENQKEISKITGLSQTTISKTIRRTEEIIKKEYYTTICNNANEIKWIKETKEQLKKIKDNPTILLWQYKYVALYFNISISEAQLLLAYARDMIDPKP